MNCFFYLKGINNRMEKRNRELQIKTNQKRIEKNKRVYFN